MMPTATPGIRQHLDPADWRHHLFGLPIARWRALREKAFWITGAGTGFGRSLAVALAAADARVILSGRRREKLLESIEEMRSLAIPVINAVPLPVDIVDPASVAAAAAAIALRHGSLHGLVHGAALPPGPDGPWPLMSMSLEGWSGLLATNVTGAWQVMRAALPMMISGGSCRIVLLTSEAGWAFTPGVGPYNVTKCALNNLGGSFAAESAARYPGADVQINVLVPGEARTEMNQGSPDSPYTIVCMALALLSHPAGGPNACFFHRDGRHLSFGYSLRYERPLFDDTS
jgi:NAD(P)-dependent dehydrogenase (short-subunit alcohol dehydrogenase family)